MGFCMLGNAVRSADNPMGGFCYFVGCGQPFGANLLMQAKNVDAGIEVHPFAQEFQVFNNLKVFGFGLTKNNGHIVFPEIIVKINFRTQLFIVLHHLKDSNPV